MKQTMTPRKNVTIATTSRVRVPDWARNWMRNNEKVMAPNRCDQMLTVSLCQPAMSFADR